MVDYIRQNKDVILQNINKTPQELQNALIEWDEYLVKQMQIIKQVKSLVASWFEWVKVTTSGRRVDIETIIWRNSEGWPSTAYFSIPYYDKNGVLQHEENMKFLEREEFQKLVNTVIKKAEERERNQG